MNEWMNDWMNEWMNEWTNKWVNECMNTWMNESIQNEEHEWDMLHYQMLVYEHRCTCARTNTISLRSCTYVSNLAYSPVPTTAIGSPSTYICNVYVIIHECGIYIHVYIYTCTCIYMRMYIWMICLPSHSANSNAQSISAQGDSCDRGLVLSLLTCSTNQDKYKHTQTCQAIQNHLIWLLETRSRVMAVWPDKQYTQQCDMTHRHVC